MEKKNNSLFFSCIVNNEYKEFVVKEESFRKASIRENFYNYKYASVSTPEENTRTLRKLKFLRDLLGEEHVSIRTLLKTLAEEKDIAFAEWLKDILSKCSLEQTFSLRLEEISGWFQSMKRYAIIHGVESEYEKQLEHYVEGLENTRILESKEMEIIDGSFKRKPQTVVIETKNAVLEKRPFEYAEKKIS